ncbi:MAG: SDR family NAD(P)-dependent oxidoreductase [Pleomorphochaeta sp.]
MVKTILVTGSTDGIGLETIKKLAKDGHYLLIHGRNANKLEKVKNIIEQIPNHGEIETYSYDLSSLSQVKDFANDIKSKHSKLDVLINNAGVFNVLEVRCENNLDTRFTINTIAPYLLTKLLMPILAQNSRVINLSSAAQAPFNVNSIKTLSPYSNGNVYAQSKLALTMWTFELAKKYGNGLNTFLAVNPGSLLASKLVKDAYGIEGSSLQIGANILYEAALSKKFNTSNGRYYDNDSKCFNNAYIDAYDSKLRNELIIVLDEIIDEFIK